MKTGMTTRANGSGEAPSVGLFMSASQSATTTGQSGDGRSQSFRAVEGGGNKHSGEVLLVQAYAAVWLLVLFFIARTYRRQRAMEVRIDQLSAELAKLESSSSGQEAEPSAPSVEAADP